MPEPASLLSHWSRLLAGSLVRAGVTQAVISPGSRSTPLTAALLATPGLECHSVLDERGAAFFALGLARATGRPPLLVCTSGTAGAHYYPAVIEAAHSDLPLLVITADRPNELADVGAAQTIVQTELFGRFARGFFQAGDPASDEGALRGLSRKAAQAVALTLGPRPGPVQLNFPAKKPLEPQLEPADTPSELGLFVTALLTRTPRVFGSAAEPSVAGVRHFSQLLAEAERPLVILGACEPSTAALVVRLAAALRAPLLAETAAHAPRALPLEQLVGARGLDLPQPDLVLRFGAPTTSASLPAFLTQLDAEQLLVCPADFPDPAQLATGVLHAPLAQAALALLDELSGNPRPNAFLEAYEHAARGLAERLDQWLAASAAHEGALTEPAAVHAALSHLTADCQLYLGNSRPLRLVDALSQQAFQGRPWPRTFVQRGVNGIDGMIAGGAGLALAGDRPTLSLLGDVTVAHDLSSLAIARSVRVPHCILLLDNAGGRIFDSLPLAAQAAEMGRDWRFWSTPPELDFEAAARTYAVRYARAETTAELELALARALSQPGPTLLHVFVDPSSTVAWFEALLGANT